jgi:hypothetical protein
VWWPFQACLCDELACVMTFTKLACVMPFTKLACVHNNYYAITWRMWWPLPSLTFTMRDRYGDLHQTCLLVYLSSLLVWWPLPSLHVRSLLLPLTRHYPMHSY